MRNLICCVFALTFMVGAFCFAWMLSMMELDFAQRLILMFMTTVSVLGCVVSLCSLAKGEEA